MAAHGADTVMSARVLGDVHHLILDRDGVLNEDLGEGRYLRDPDSVRWIPGALGSLAILRAAGIRVSIATNQSAVGRGVMSELELKSVHDHIATEAGRAGGSIDAIYFCPHAPDVECLCRKPRPGLIQTAIDESAVARHHTLVVGDAICDIEAAHAAGTHAVLVRTGKGRIHEAHALDLGVPVFDDFPSLVTALTQERRSTALPLESLKLAFDEHTSVVEATVRGLLPRLAIGIEVIRRCLESGGKILACGNGGSAADAQHFVAEFVGRFKASRRALPAIFVGGDSATLTAIGNDFGFEQVFARAVEAFAKPGDVLVALSTSGNSPNVLQAVQAAHVAGCAVVALTGRTGGALGRRSTLTLNVPSDTVARIQEVHGICLHLIAAALETGPAPAGPA